MDFILANQWLLLALLLLLTVVLVRGFLALIQDLNPVAHGAVRALHPRHQLAQLRKILVREDVKDPGNISRFYLDEATLVLKPFWSWALVLPFLWAWWQANINLGLARQHLQEDNRSLDLG